MHFRQEKNVICRSVPGSDFREWVAKYGSTTGIRRGEKVRISKVTKSDHDTHTQMCFLVKIISIKLVTCLQMSALQKLRRRILGQGGNNL